MPKRTDTNTRRNKRTVPAATAPPRAEELSAYELLERRSLELTKERAHGGFGTSQPPNAAVPLLYPGPRTDRAPEEMPAGKPAKRSSRPRQTKKKR